MTTDAATTADRLLDAQVAHVLGQLTDEHAAELVADDVRLVLAALDDVVVEDFVDVRQVRATALALIDAVGDSPAVAEIVTTLVPALRALPAHADHRLGDVVDREAVEVFVDTLGGSEGLREEALARLGRSPAVSALALRFVSALVGDAVQQNRDRAEKVPGMKSLLGVGDFAARQARGMAPKPLEKLVGGAADKGAQAAMDRVSRALVDAYDPRAVRAAVLEVWDLHARDPIAGLDAYLGDDELARLVSAGHDVWLGLRTSPWFLAMVDEAATAFLDTYGEGTVGELLEALGLDHEVIAAEVANHAGPALDTLGDVGVLEVLVRRRLAPFFASDAAHAILGDA